MMCLCYGCPAGFWLFAGLVCWLAGSPAWLDEHLKKLGLCDFAPTGPSLSPAERERRYLAVLAKRGIEPLPEHERPSHGSNGV